MQTELKLFIRLLMVVIFGYLGASFVGGSFNPADYKEEIRMGALFCMGWAIFLIVMLS